MTFREILRYLREQYITKTKAEIYSDNGWCVYSADEKISLNSVCYVDNYPDFDEDDNEIPLPFVYENGLEMCYRDEELQDVISVCLNQKKDISIEEIMESLNYYEENDTFLIL